MRILIYCAVIFLTLSRASVLQAGDDKLLYRKAVKMASEGQADFAFMQYRSIINYHPQSEYLSEALFASGEYYFLNREYEKSRDFFDQYIGTAGNEHEGKLFALMYRLWLAQYAGDSEGYDNRVKDILAYRRQAYVFSDTKTYVYTSPLNQELRADYEIETIKFFINGQPFTQITF